MKMNDEENVMLREFELDTEENNMNQRLIESLLIQSKYVFIVVL